MELSAAFARTLLSGFDHAYVDLHEATRSIGCRAQERDLVNDTWLRPAPHMALDVHWRAQRDGLYPETELLAPSDAPGVADAVMYRQVLTRSLASLPKCSRVFFVVHRMHRRKRPKIVERLPFCILVCPFLREGPPIPSRPQIFLPWAIDAMTFTFFARPGLFIVSRLLAAVLGGYAFASAVAVLLAAALPIPKAEAVLAGIQWSFVAHVAAAIWAFSPVSLARMWSVLIVLTGALLAAALVFGCTTLGD